MKINKHKQIFHVSIIKLLIERASQITRLRICGQAFQHYCNNVLCNTFEEYLWSLLYLNGCATVKYKCYKITIIAFHYCRNI